MSLLIPDIFMENQLWVCSYYYHLSRWIVKNKLDKLCTRPYNHDRIKLYG